MSKCSYCPARLSADSTAQRWTFLKIAVGEFVALFGLLVLLVVDPQMPLAVFAESVAANEFIFFPCGRLVLAPVIALVDDDFFFLDERFVAAFYSITKPYSWSCDSRAGESRFIPSAEKSSRLQTAPPMLRNTY